MKRSFILLLTLALGFSMSACGSSSASNEGNQQTSNTSVSVSESASSVEELPVDSVMEDVDSSETEDTEVSVSEPVDAGTEEETEDQTAIFDDETAGTTEETAQAVTEVVVPEDLSDDPFSMQVAVNGKVITIPCMASDFEEAGFVFSEDELNQEMESGYLLTLGAHLDNGCELHATFKNHSGETRKFRDIPIESIRLQDNAKSDAAVMLPGGITFGTTKDEVLNFMSGMEVRYEDEELLPYENEEENQITYHFDENNVLWIYEIRL